jgi:hypothetical protein
VPRVFLVVCNVRKLAFRSMVVFGEESCRDTVPRVFFVRNVRKLVFRSMVAFGGA